ncbi:MAG: extracellular solute-binding protein [Lachnospiraceae bacterium]|nr:extracellular solute-binding protein [Lachnospiraceae bacterium]
MKKQIVALMLSVVMVGSFAGCGNNQSVVGGESEEPSSAASASETEKTESGKTEISLLVDVSRDVVGESGYGTGFYTALDDWQKAHPDVEINIEEMDQTSYQTKITALGSSDDMPDLFMLKGSWTKNFVDNGWVQDITEDLDADTQWRDAYIEGAFEYATQDGKIYGVPRESLSTGLIFYNADMWSEIGYDEFPTTWDELLDAVQKFNEKGITAFVMGNKPNWPAESCWLSTLGDRFTGPDWTSSILKGDGAKFTDDTFVAALTAFKELADAGAFNADINSIDDQEQQSVYFNKKAAAVANGTWFIPTVDTTAPEDVKNATKLAVLPSVTGGSENQNTVSGGCVWFTSISNKVQDVAKRELCIDLLKAVTGKQVGDITASYGGVTPWANPEYDTTKVPELYNEYLKLMETTVNVPVYDACMDSGVIETMNQGLQSLLIGEKTPEALAEEIQLEQDQVVME